MAKDLSAAVQTQIDSLQHQPVLLFELGLTPTVRFASLTKGNIVFGGKTYTAKAIQMSNVNQTAEGQIERITVNFDNVSKDMSAYANVESFYGKTLKIYRVYRGALGSSSNYNELFNGYMEEVESIDPQWLTVTATVGKPLEKKLLNKVYQRKCGNNFGDSQCNKDGLADLSGTTMKLYVSDTSNITGNSSTTFCDSVNLTQVDDYFNFGSIEFCKSGATYTRTVVDFKAATDEIEVDVALPFTIDTSLTSYTVMKGCPGTWEACSATYNYGPSADNRANFKGFIHIGTPEP